MAQFVGQSYKVVQQGQQQPVLVQSYVQQSQPQVVQTMVQQPVVQTMVQQPVVVLQGEVQRPYHETQGLLKKEDKLALLSKKTLFFTPFVFFLLLLIFSSVLYHLRYEHSNETSPAAYDVLNNFGRSLKDHPIIHIEVLSKYKKKDDKTSGLNDCKSFKGKNKKYEGKFEKLTLGEFGEIKNGCVCKRTKFGKTFLAYHDEDYCTDNIDANCQYVMDRDAVKEHYLLDDLFCALRAETFLWKKKDATKACKDHKDAKGKALKACGDEICISDNKDYKECPFTKLAIEKKAYKLKTGEKDDQVKLVHQKSTLKVVTKRDKNHRPVIQIQASISNPSCLAQNLQKPQRQSKKSYKFQNIRETNCSPYGAHVYTEVTDAKATLNQGYIDTLSQKAFYKSNDIKTDKIPFYQTQIMDANDYMNIYTEVRPSIKNDNVCRSGRDIQNIAHSTRQITYALELVGDYALAFIITSVIGLVVSAAFIALKTKPFVNKTTQLYLHLYTMAVMIAVFVYGVKFLHHVHSNQTELIEEGLALYTASGCFLYRGQVDAARHFNLLAHALNNAIYGITVFLFVVSILSIFKVLVSSVIRKQRQLNVCEPMKGDQYYYSN